jgi:hypothetical protein
MPGPKRHSALIALKTRPEFGKSQGNDPARFRRRRPSAAAQWLVISLNPNVMIEIANANRTTPTATIQTSRSVGYGLTAFFAATGAGASRRIRDGRGASFNWTVFLPGFNCLLTGASLRLGGYGLVSITEMLRHAICSCASVRFPA